MERLRLNMVPTSTFLQGIAVISTNAILDSNAFTPVNALKLDDVHVEFFGSVHLPQDIPYVQNIVANSTDFAGHWFRFTGKNLKWYGTKDVATGWIECESPAFYSDNCH